MSSYLTGPFLIVLNGLRPGRGKQKTGRRRLPVFVSLDEVQNEGENNEHRGGPLGQARQTGVQSLGLVLGQEGVAAAADGAGETGVLAALQKNDADDGEAGQKLYNGNDRL